MLAGEELMSCAATESLREFITAKGLKMSRKRFLVLEAFFSTREQTSVDDLFVKLRTKHSSLARSTVSLTMKLIVACGIARVILVDGINRYVPVREESIDST